MNTTSKWLKTMVTSLLVTVALVLPMSTVGDNTTKPLLGFDGVEMIVHDDGSVQMLFDVYVQNVTRGEGAFFTLNYNPNYLTPSDFDENKAIPDNGSGSVPTDAFFRVADGFAADELYMNDNDDFYPFKKDVDGTDTSNYSTWYPTDSAITMVLIVDHETLKNRSLDAEGDDLYTNDKLDPIVYGEENNEKTAFVYNKDGTDQDRVVLGRLSFRVTDTAKLPLEEVLPEIVEYFDGHDDEAGTVTVTVKVDGVDQQQDIMLIDLKDKTTPGTASSTVSTDWGVAYYGDRYGSASPTTWRQQYAYHGDGKVTSRFTFNFPRTVIDVRAAESELTINAYQAFTNNNMGDLAIALGKYSPMVTVTYADGTRENHVFQWNKEDKDEYKASYYDENATNKVGSAVTATDYKATGGDYIITQKYVYTDALGVERVFPVPVDVHMTVTPIKLVDVTATDLTRTYALNGLVGRVHTGADLYLPEYARLVTDVVPGGVSMVMEISGWKPVNGAWPVVSGSGTADDTLMNSIKGDSNQPESTDPIYWPDDNDIEESDSGTLDPAKHVGNYTFIMDVDDTDDPNKTDNDGNVYFTKGEITPKYPWLTVTKERYKVPEALRRIVGGATTLTENYEVTYESTVTHVSEAEKDPSNGNPTLTLNVKKTDGSMSANSQFRVWLPNGQELGTGLNSKDISSSETFPVENWFDDNDNPAVDEEKPNADTASPGDDVNGFYQRETYKDDRDYNAFYLRANPGDTYTDPDADNAAQREVLRRYINLGGWFYVSVNEDPDENLWSDPIPVYVPPRVNFYTEDKSYDFTGDNSGLFHWIFGTGLGTTVTMPQGTYTGLVKDAAGNMVTGKIEYGYTTTYDGTTGAEPGMNYTFTIEPRAGEAGWAAAADAGTGTTTYGANDFKNEATYTAYGTVNQPRDADGDGVDDDNADSLGKVDHTVTILTDQTPKEAPTEGLVLKCITPNANVVYDIDADGNEGNVTLATYDTQTEGYTVRQDYVFTLTNTGTTDIYGIGIDTITDGCTLDDGGGGHFELLLPPTAFLRAGETTTFVLTYVYDLRDKGNDAFTYRDTLHVTTAANPEGVIDFDAQFRVAGKQIHKVTVETKPSDGSLGTAGVIIGEVTTTAADGTTTKTMNYTPASTAYMEEEWVYVVVRPVDEYTPTVEIKDANNNTLPDWDNDPSKIDYAYPPPDELNPAKLADGTLVYYFKMPASDVTVTVTFREDLLSKLRLQNLVDYSGSKVDENGQLTGFRAQPGQPGDTIAGDLDYTADPSYIYKVWQKAFTDLNLKDAAAVLAAAKVGTPPTGSEGDDDKLYLMHMERGSAGVYKFDPSVDLYMVVIPYEAEWSQVEATIRELVYHDLDGDGTDDNFDIAVTVRMEWFPDWDPVTGVPNADNKPVELAVEEATGYTGSLGTSYGGTGSTTHVSNVFKSPEPGDSDYVRITLTASDGTASQHRRYYLEIHRSDRDRDQVLGYGNSPFGMIMNDSKLVDDDDPTLTAARQAAAKQAFIDAGYTFVGMGDHFVPEVVKNNAMDDSTDLGGRAAVYWREAWVVNDKLYEPESGTGVDDPRVYFDDRVTAGLDEDPYGYFLSDPYRLYNLDLYEYSLFAIMGQELTDPGLLYAEDSSGRKVDVKQVRVECTVTLLNTTGTTQVARFSGTNTVTLSMGMSGFKDTAYESWAAQEVQTGTDANGDPVMGKVAVDNIRPGRYVMEYVYADYDGTEIRVTRPFVILAPLGDVNADLAVDNIQMAATAGAKAETNDEYLVENRVTDPLGWFAGSVSYNDDGNMYPFANIFRYRVCDVNNDRNVNNIDANELEAYAETEVTRKNYPLFYLPTGYAQ